MASLSEVYGKDPPKSRQRLSRNKLGYIIMSLGGLLTLFGVTGGTTGLLIELFGFTFDQVQLFGGVFTGTGVLFLVGGMFTSVSDKSSIESRLGWTGIVLILFSLSWFVVQFPGNWNVYDFSTVPLVGFTYATGMMLLLIITFHSVVNYRLKSEETFTVTHRFEEKTHHIESETTQSNDHSQPATPSTKGGGIGLIGRLPPESRETYGARSPMTKEDRERHSVGRNNSNN